MKASLYCPNCDAYTRQDAFRGETIRAFRCEECEKVEEWDLKTMTVTLRDPED